ncbi:MFS transporter [Geomesophilobacter sediminis]|uniref:MFS transporter n=1 Tax=Geomesophilobacter sediminis TaxID=2798584 RepID=A0A8J7M2C2_9BACT|nr:MFS transporter [Geomesophilobacter sediminis]MBJ6727224.1 MFS transporter [Geomesophilobacter sediminis]
MSSRHPENRRFLALAGSCVAIFWPGALAFGFPGVLAPYWMTMFHAGKGAIGNTLFFNLASLGIVMFFVGRWQERYGMRAMIMVGTVFLSLNMLTIAYAANLGMLYLWAFLNGAATCFIYTPAMTTVQRWFTRRRGLASGVINFTFGISAAIMSPLFHKMVASIGYVRMNLVVAVLALVCGLIAAPFTASPEQLKRPPALEPEAPDPLIPHHPSLSVRQCVRTRSFWFLWATWALQGAAGIGMVSLATTFGLSRGYAMPAAVLILTAFNTLSGFGRIIMGYLSDHVNRNRAMSVTFTAAGVAYLLLLQVSGLAGIMALAAVIGLAFGTLFSVSGPLAADCFGMRHFGAIIGLVFTAYGFFAGLLGATLSGYILDLTGGNFSIIFGYLSVCCFVAGVCIRFVTPPELEPDPDSAVVPARSSGNPS